MMKKKLIMTILAAFLMAFPLQALAGMHNQGMGGTSLDHDQEYPGHQYCTGHPGGGHGGGSDDGGGHGGGGHGH